MDEQNKKQVEARVYHSFLMVHVPAAVSDVCVHLTFPALITAIWIVCRNITFLQFYWVTTPCSESRYWAMVFGLEMCVRGKALGRTHQPWVHPVVLSSETRGLRYFPASSPFGHLQFSLTQDIQRQCYVEATFTSSWSVTQSYLFCFQWCCYFLGNSRYSYLNLHLPC